MNGLSHHGGVKVWLGARTRVVAIVALFAMALQIVGTFGHVHVPKLSGVSVVAQSGTIARAALVQAELPADQDTAVSDSHQRSSGADGDALCPLCLVGNLVASAVAASVPVLVLPIAYAIVEPLHFADGPAPTDSLTSFWSRGPPTP